MYLCNVQIKNNILKYLNYGFTRQSFKGKWTEQCIGTVRWRPKQEGDPRQLPIAWVSEDDLLNLLGYNKQFKKLEAISLSVGWAAYPQKEYEENLEKYKDIRAQFSKHKKK